MMFMDKKRPIICPKISIIVPVYNSSKTLRRCIDSVLSQDFTDFELILIDDGSSDSSFAICQEYAKKDSRIISIHQENSGPSMARNHGISRAKGEFINFIDSDDYVDPDYLTSFDMLNLSEEIDIVFCGMKADYTDGTKHVMRLPAMQCIGKGNMASFVYKIHSLSMIGWVCNKIYRTHIIKTNNLSFDGSIRIREDQIFTLEYLHYAKGAKSIEAAKYHYVIHGGSLMSAAKDYIDYQKIALRVLENFRYFSEHKDLWRYCNQSYLDEYLVGIGAIRKDSNYSSEEKERFLKGCITHVKNTKCLDLRFSDNQIKNFIKKMLFLYTPFSFLKKLYC